MKIVKVRYGIIFGKHDSTDWMEHEIALTDEEADVYDQAVSNQIPLMDVPELAEVLNLAYEEIEELEIQNGINMEVEYVLECQGKAPMDLDELNDLIADRDPHALEFFALKDASEEDIDEWDAYELEDIPTVAEFQPDFEPYSPFDEGWILRVEFVDPNE